MYHILKNHSAALRQSAKLSKGITVATVEDPTPTAAITVAIPAGSRHEPIAGAAHVLKNLVLRSTFKRSALAIARQVELNGGLVSSTLTREHLLLTAEFIKGDEGFFAELLGDVLTSSRFPDWEYSEDVLPQLEIEYAQALQDPSVTAIEKAHQLAFRNGLGNSLFVSPELKVPHSKATQYARVALSSPGVTVVGTGMKQDSLAQFVEEFYTKSHKNVDVSGIDFDNPEVKPVNTASEYFGGHARIPHKDHSYSYSHHAPPATDRYLIAFPSAPSTKSQAFDVLAHLLGGGAPAVKWTTGASPLSKTFSSKVQTFNFNYSDAGLFGFLIDAETRDVKSVAQGTIKELKNVASGAKEEDLKRAVAKAKFTIAESWEGRVGRTVSVATQLANSQGSVSSLADTLSAYDSVKISDVAEAANALLKAKPTSVAVGDTRNLPYVEEFL
ncbi:LuxS/MPP-like metallohydrolase [Atractiella rhizophila]|nr:LuxS/MPP-like metallohydrolase [Atractiella rhizophila]